MKQLIDFLKYTTMTLVAFLPALIAAFIMY